LSKEYFISLTAPEEVGRAALRGKSSCWRLSWKQRSFWLDTAGFAFYGPGGNQLPFMDIVWSVGCLWLAETGYLLQRAHDEVRFQSAYTPR
jgi:hypothetical protein